MPDEVIAAKEIVDEYAGKLGSAVKVELAGNDVCCIIGEFKLNVMMPKKVSDKISPGVKGFF